MTVRSASFLHTRRSGPEDGDPWLLLHDRYGTMDDSAALADAAGPGIRAIAVRGARTQTIGGHGDVHSYYWYFGPRQTPELSTLGDALFQLETVLLETAQVAASGRAGLAGRGEGGVLALLTALIWPEKLSRVIAIDAGLPQNLADIPIDPQRLDGLKITLIAPDPATREATIAHLSAAGADLEVLETEVSKT